MPALPLMARRRPLLAATGCAGLAAVRRGAAASPGPDPVDLLLVLAVDVSSSISNEEARLQREGYCAALTDAEVLAGIAGGSFGAVGLAYVEWSGVERQRLLLPWTRIASAADAARCAAALARHPHRPGRGTSIAGGIGFSCRLITAAPWDAPRRVIDVSGDGVNNGSLAVERTRDLAVLEGVTINGLAIVGTAPQEGEEPGRIADHYRTAMAGGPGAFVVEVRSFEDFGAAVRRKLVREVAGPACAGSAAAA